MYQVEHPMIHTLYEEMENLVKTFMGRFLKEEFFHNKQPRDIKISEIEMGENWRRVDIGVDTESVIEGLSEKDKKFLRMGARSFYKAVVIYLLKNLPLKNQILRHVKCLHPSYRLKDGSLQSIKFLATQLSSVIAVNEVSSVTDEFIRLQGEEDSSVFPQCSSAVDTTSNNLSDADSDLPQLPSKAKCERVDVYWGHIFKIKNVMGNLKYPNLGKLVKALLSLPHGNADVERNFSKHLLESRSSLSLESFNAVRKAKCHLKANCDNNIQNLKTSPELIKYVRHSHTRKNERLLAQMKKTGTKWVNEDNAEEENNRKKEEKLKNEEKELAEKLTAVQKMLDNAQKTIASGVKSRDMATVESGQVLLEEATKRMNDILSAQQKNQTELAKIKTNVKRKKN